MDRGHFEVLADGDQRHWWLRARRRILGDVLAAVLPAGPAPGEAPIVIDVGCGTGANIAALAGAYRCIGIDTAPSAIELARKRFPDVEFRCGIAPQDLGDVIGRAGAVLLMDVLEHVEDDHAMLAPLVRALSPGALVVITVPADMRLWSAHDEGLLHFRRYDEATLRAAWRGLPVEPIAVTNFCTHTYPIARVQRGLARLLARSRPRHADWTMPVPVAPLNRFLERLFASESRGLVEIVRGRRGPRRTPGSSLLAVLRRTAEQPGAATAPRAEARG